MELFARPLLSASPGVAWPGDDKINDEAEAACDRAFLDYVGIAYDDSAYRVTYFTPFEASCVQNDDRLVLCTVEARARAPFMQSVRGSRR